MEKINFLEKLQKLVELGKKKNNTLDVTEVNDFFANDNLSPEQMEEIYSYMEQHGIDVESFKVYHDEESIFRPITLKENNQAMKKLRKQAEKDAIANGLLDNAKSNAEVMLKGFFAQEYDLKDYKLVFEYKEEK